MVFFSIYVYMFLYSSCTMMGPCFLTIKSHLLFLWYYCFKCVQAGGRSGTWGAGVQVAPSPAPYQPRTAGASSSHASGTQHCGFLISSHKISGENAQSFLGNSYLCCHQYSVKLCFEHCLSCDWCTNYNLSNLGLGTWHFNTSQKPFCIL
jgi:hypothetical protein